MKLLCREQVSESGRGAGSMSWLVLDGNSAWLLEVEGTSEESSRKLKREEKGCERESLDLIWSQKCGGGPHRVRTPLIDAVSSWKEGCCGIIFLCTEKMCL